MWRNQNISWNFTFVNHTSPPAPICPPENLSFPVSQSSKHLAIHVTRHPITKLILRLPHSAEDLQREGRAGRNACCFQVNFHKLHPICEGSHWFNHWRKIELENLLKWHAPQALLRDSQRNYQEWSQYIMDYMRRINIDFQEFIMVLE